MSTRARGRRPGISTTRDEIVRATAEIVEAEGINRATARAIASRAKVDPALIYRHFGNKDALFDEVFQKIFASMPGYDRDIANGRELVELALDLWENPGRRMIGMSVIRSATASERASATARKVITRTILKKVGSSVRSDHHDLRVALIAAQMVGIVLVRHGIRLPALSRTTRADIVRAAAPVIEHFMHGDLGPEHSSH